MGADKSDGDRSQLRNLIHRVVARGSEVALDYFRTDIEVKQKISKMDLVTGADTDVQEAIIAEIRKADFDTTIDAEEESATKTVPRTGDTWVIDPIDGTNNFVRGSRLWAVSATYLADKESVVSTTSLPALDDTYITHDGHVTRNDRGEDVSDRTDLETFTATPIFGLKRSDRRAYQRISTLILEEFGDLRRFGSGQTTLAALACGELDAAISTIQLSPCDTIGVSI